MHKKAFAVIAAIMMTSMAAFSLSISTTTVKADHTIEAPSIDKDLFKYNTAMVRTITVKNLGPDPIDNVRITVPTGFTDFAPTKLIPKDNLARTDVSTENLVILKAGTTVRISLAAENVRLAENTDVIREKDTWVHDGIENYLLAENALVEVRHVTDTLENLLIGDNVAPVLDKSLTLIKENKVRLIADTMVVLVTAPDIVRLPENTWVEMVVDDNASDFTTGDNVTMKVERRVSLTKENGEDVSIENRENRVRTVTSVKAYLRGGATEVTLGAGRDLLLIPSVLEAAGGTDVVLPVGARVQLLTPTQVLIPENTDVIRPADNLLKVIDIAAMENRPKNWMQVVSPPTVVEWKGIAENRIAKDDSLAFPFAVKTPTADGIYDIWVKTTDTKGDSREEKVTVTVDNVHPTVMISVSPEWSKAKTEVTITITASEPLAKLENVMVAENMAPENTQIPKEDIIPSPDKTVWTCKYITGDNEKRDGEGKIYVIGAQFEDRVGNLGSENTGIFKVDKVKPPTPDVLGSLKALKGIPEKKYTNDAVGQVEGTAKDNYRGVVEGKAGMTIRIRIGTVVETIKSKPDNTFFKSITLSEGTNEIGIQFVDFAGNEGDENAENIILDTVKPSISIVTPEKGKWIKDNTPSIGLTISDVTMGVENAAFDFADNSGYEVKLCYENKDVIATLSPKVHPTVDPFKFYTFENDYPIALADRKYLIFVQAGDNLQKENVYSEFTIDTVAPAAPTLITSFPSSTEAEPVKLKARTVTLSGSGEVGATVNVWTSVSPFIVDVLATSVTVGADGMWSATITPTAGVVTRIRVNQVDVAGNEGTKTLYGYVKVDATAPTITALAIEGVAYVAKVTTDKPSIELTGKVTDDVSEPVGITLTVSYGAVSRTVSLAADGTFETVVPLSEGLNIISLTATDEAGNTTPATTLEVERTVVVLTTWAIVLVIIALVLAAIAIFVRR